jgi:RNA polymerase sigma factor (sigma-70 family)
MMEIFNNGNQVDNWNHFIKSGDLDALSQVYFHYYDLLFTYGLKITSDRQIVEDSIQNVFLSCIKSRKNITEVKSLNGYLVSSFRRELFNSLEKKRKNLYLADVNTEQFDYFKIHEQGNTDKRELEKLYQVIKQCVNNLSSKQQEILYLRFESEISYEDISRMMNISIESCYKSVYRAIRIIRKEAEKIIIKDPDDFVFLLICCLSLKRS